MPKAVGTAPADRYAFDIPYRDENQIGNIKYIWEPSRHHHLTILAAAYAVTGDERLRKAHRRPFALMVERKPVSNRSALDQRH